MSENRKSWFESEKSSEWTESDKRRARHESMYSLYQLDTEKMSGVLEYTRIASRLFYLGEPKYIILNVPEILSELPQDQWVTSFRNEMKWFRKTLADANEYESHVPYIKAATGLQDWSFFFSIVRYQPWFRAVKDKYGLSLFEGIMRRLSKLDRRHLSRGVYTVVRCNYEAADLPNELFLWKAPKVVKASWGLPIDNDTSYFRAEINGYDLVVDSSISTDELIVNLHYTEAARYPWKPYIIEAWAGPYRMQFDGLNEHPRKLDIHKCPFNIWKERVKLRTTEGNTIIIS